MPLDHGLCHLDCALHILRTLLALLDLDTPSTAPQIEALKEALSELCVLVTRHRHLLVVQLDRSATPMALLVRPVPRQEHLPHLGRDLRPVLGLLAVSTRQDPIGQCEPLGVGENLLVMVTGRVDPPFLRAAGLKLKNERVYHVVCQTFAGELVSFHCRLCAHTVLVCRLCTSASQIAAFC